MVYYNSDQGQVSWNEELQAVKVEWKGFADGEELQRIMLKAIELLATRKSGKLLMDSSKASVVKAEDRAWIAQEFVTKAYDAGLRFMAMTIPEKTVAKLSLGRIVSNFDDLPYKAKNFSEITEATEWLSVSSL
ncbi:hypothetical protein [Paenibacillus agricola]|uniref:STAS/SEC14 domain-containing protein n=1 Tax=Paenibacillus agricola TaxID=2716264 RepID=A0ABX0J1Z4_9BACL|nr:hypothetical protein [Paenibacillus agricola]NHN30152.1 hypothetical protein [Paenibacillus agricola]